MSRIINISEAASIALHGIILIAKSNKMINAIQIAEKGWKQACIDSVPLRKGLNVVDGKVVYKGVAEAFDLPYEKVESVL